MMSSFRIIDDRGRLFGRLNIIDAVALGFIVLLLPLGYVAFWLLRPPVPQILAIDPPSLKPGQEQRVRLSASDLRPFLRAMVGGKPAALLVESPTSAELRLPDLAPGTYELVLYDATQEVARKAAAIVIEAPPAPVTAPAPLLPDVVLDVLGAFTGLDSATARALASRPRLGQEGMAGSAQILYAQAAEPEVLRLKELPVLARREADRFRVVSLLRLHCGFTGGDCTVGGTAVAPGAGLTLSHGATALNFQVVGLFPATSDSLPEITVIGAFVGLDEAGAGQLASARPATLCPPESWGRVLSLGQLEPEMVRLRGRTETVGAGTTGEFRVGAAIAIRCAVAGGECRVGNTPIAADARLPILTRYGIKTFEVADLYPADVGPRSQIRALVRALGKFVGLDSSGAAKLSTLQLPESRLTESWGEILSLDQAEVDRRQAPGRYQVGAFIAVRCKPPGGTGCKVGNTVVAPNATLAIPTSQGILFFQVAETVSDDRPIVEVNLNGAFVGVDAPQSAAISTLQGSSHEFWGGILSAGPSVPEGGGQNGRKRVTAMISLRCTVFGGSYQFGGMTVAPRSTVVIPTSQGFLRYEVEEISRQVAETVSDDRPTVEVNLLGAFVGVDAPQSAAISKLQGPSREFWGGILSVGPSEPEGGGKSGRKRVTASLSLRCTTFGDSYRFGGTTVAPKSIVEIPTSEGFLRYEVEEVFRADAGPAVELGLSGTFVGLDTHQIPALTKMSAANQAAAESWGRVVSLGPPEGETVQLGRQAGMLLPAVPTGRFRVGAVVRVRCVVVGTECRIGSAPIVPDGRFTLRTSIGKLTFEVSDMYPADVQSSANVKVVGAFVGLDAASAGKLTAMATAKKSSPESWGRILSVRPAEPETLRLPGRNGSLSTGATDRLVINALISLRCTVVGATCRIGNAVVAPDSRIALPTELGVLMFVIKDLYPADLTFVDITIKGATDKTILDLAQRQPTRRGDPDEMDLRPTLLGLKTLEEKVTVRTGGGSFEWEQGGVAISAVIRVPAQKDASGWIYLTRPLKAGEMFTYTHSSFTLSGTITDIRLANSGTQ